MFKSSKDEWRRETHVGIFPLSPKYRDCTPFECSWRIACPTPQAPVQWRVDQLSSHGGVNPEVVGKPVAFDEGRGSGSTKRMLSVHCMYSARSALPPGRSQLGSLSRSYPHPGLVHSACDALPQEAILCISFGCFPEGTVSTDRGRKWPRRSPVHQAPRASPNPRTSAFAPYRLSSTQNRGQARCLVGHRFLFNEQREEL